MRYQDTGAVHLDFHRTMNGTLAWLRRNYGMALVDDILRRTARDVYRSIREELKAGRPEALISHWTTYLEREGGRFSVERNADTVRVIVHRCPAADYLQQNGIPIDEAFRRQTKVLNDALCEETPFIIETEITDDLRYTQTLRRRSA